MLANKKKKLVICRLKLMRPMMQSAQVILIPPRPRKILIRPMLQWSPAIPSPLLVPTKMTTTSLFRTRTREWGIMSMSMSVGTRGLGEWCRFLLVGVYDPSLPWRQDEIHYYHAIAPLNPLSMICSSACKAWLTQCKYFSSSLQYYISR